MKQFYLVILFLLVAVSGFSQNSTSDASANKYRQTLNEKEDFWFKVKNIFKPKKEGRKVRRTSDPVLVKNDPNRTIKRVRRDKANSIDEFTNENNIENNSVTNDAEGIVPEKKKRTFSQFWNELVNGKGYTPAKDYSTVRRKQRQQQTNSEMSAREIKTPTMSKGNEPIRPKSNTNQNGDHKIILVEKKLRENDEKSEIIQTENVKRANTTHVAVSGNYNANKVGSKPVNQNTGNKDQQGRSGIASQKVANRLNPNDSKPIVSPATSAVVESNTIAKVNVTPAESIIKAKSGNPSKLNNQNVVQIKTHIAEHKSNESIDTNPKILAEAKPKVLAPAVKDYTIRNEIQPLSLTQTASGTAAYFFSGGSYGKFYAVTNLVSKGQVIKIINTQNGKSLLAEVIEALPTSDARKGLIIKISDNAKLPLGQNNKSFSVKVNY